MNLSLYSLFAVLVFGASAMPKAAERTPAPVVEGCLAAAAWSVPDGARFRPTSANTVLAAIAKRDVVLLGETHDEDDHHYWQLQTLAGLYALRPALVIGFEMFPRRLQTVLQRWVAGELTAQQLHEQSEWDSVWNVPFDLYLPLFQFARINRIPMLALNVDSKLNKAITEKGWDGVAPAEREGVGRAAPPPAAYRDFLFEVYGQHATLLGNKVGKQDDKAFRYFVESQTTWDRAMAEALADALAQRVRPVAGAVKPLVVGIMGSGHVRFGHGVAHQLRALGVNNVGALLPLAIDMTCQQLRPGLADAVFALPLQALAKAPPPRLGVQLEQHDGAVSISVITPGSLAERSGLKSGDRLLELGGVAVKKVAAVIAAIRQQAAGSWLPLRLQRGDATLELVVKFPPPKP